MSHFTFPILVLSLAISSSAMARNPGDEYYSGDIFEAIEAAKKDPHHYDYSGRHRYNRSTKQSIDLPRLKNKEMATETILAPTQPAEAAIADSTQQDQDTKTSKPEGLRQEQQMLAPTKVAPTVIGPLNPNANVNNESTINVIVR